MSVLLDYCWVILVLGTMQWLHTNMLTTSSEDCLTSGGDYIWCTMVASWDMLHVFIEGQFMGRFIFVHLYSLSSIYKTLRLYYSTTGQQNECVYKQNTTSTVTQGSCLVTLLMLLYAITKFLKRLHPFRVERGVDPWSLVGCGVGPCLAVRGDIEVICGGLSGIECHKCKANVTMGLPTVEDHRRVGSIWCHTQLKACTTSLVWRRRQQNILLLIALRTWLYGTYLKLPYVECSLMVLPGASILGMLHPVPEKGEPTWHLLRLTVMVCTISTHNIVTKVWF